MDLRDEMMLQKANKKMAKERKKEMKRQGGKKSPVRKIVLGVLIFLAAVLLVALVYVAYVFIAYYRIEDNKVLTVDNNGNATGNVETGREYTMVSYNIGFGAYSPDFSFFMDGGDDSRAKSKQSVINLTDGAYEQSMKYNPDFVLMQEVDTDADRSHHVNQYERLKEAFKYASSSFAQNYDSPYLFYPFLEPHGASESGLAIFSKYTMQSALRRQLPVAKGFSKILDLDRCYSVNRFSVEDGKELVVFHVHLSAYGSDASVREGQTEMLCEDMAKEVAAGNYVICGGDFNHDLKADEENTEDAVSWAYPFPRSKLPKGLTFAMDFLEEEERRALVNSTRNTDIPYDAKKSYTVLVDGFIISDNIEMTEYYVDYTGYMYSDHEPVVMRFILK